MWSLWLGLLICYSGGAAAAVGNKAKPSYYPGVDNILKAGFDVSTSYALSNVTVLHSGPAADDPSGGVAYPSGTSFLLKEFTKSMVCDFVIFTAHDRFTNSYLELDLWRAAYAAAQPVPHCLFNINSDKEYPTPLSRPHNFDRHLERYRSAIAINWLIDEGKLITSDPETRAIPWAMYLDSDIAFTNKYLGVQSILNRLENGLLQPSAEQRVCGPPPGAPAAAAGKAVTKGKKDDVPPFTCAPSVLATPPRSMSEIAFVIAPEVNCFEGWGVNSGSWLYKPSRITSTIFTSVLYGYRQKITHKFYGMDQGYMNWVLEELFGLDFNRLRNFCLPFKEDYWSPGFEKNELLFSRPAKLSPDEPAIKQVLEFYFPNNQQLNVSSNAAPGLQADGRPSEPKYAIYVNPRWINAAGCPWVMAHPQRSSITWKPGDFVVHFNSCHAAGFRTTEFRAMMDKAKELIAIPPDYNWEAQWLVDAIQTEHPNGKGFSMDDPLVRAWENTTPPPPPAAKPKVRKAAPKTA